MINTELLESNVNGTIHGMFDERAKYYPDRVAVRYKGKSYTYLEIKLKSNKLARYILKKTSYLSTKYIVGFYLEKSLETAISILGILKSGCAYVAIDTSYPPERIKYILNDCACSIILTCNKLYPIINKIIISLNLQDYIQLVIVDDVYINECSDNLPEQRVLAKQLAYIIYTSGSTGTPKGVMVSHQNVISSNQWVYEHTKCAENHVVDCSANLSFSATVNVLLMPLSYGHTVVMCDDECKQDPIKYINYLLEEGISLIKTTPSYLRGMLVVLKSTRIMLPRIKQLIVAGERLNQSDLLAWLDYAPNSNIIHHYGCTEITAGCLIYRNLNHKVISSCDYVPLNEISPNNKFYIVDGDLQQVASNVVGELCISGMNVALGYINNHKLTKEKFVENPFSKEKSYAKLYKTGDLVKRNSNGYIEFIGRRDSQVKVRGYRIELTEIEKALEAHSKLQKAVVLTSEDDNQKLIAYFTADCELLSDALAEHTQALLPNYMLPSLFIQIKEFPLTANKKIDIKVLRALKSTREIHVDDRPQTDLEKQLYKVWTDVLNLDNLGMQDDFFRVGGDSILSIQLVSKVRYLGIDLDVQDIFEQRNIKNLAKHICSSKAKHRITAEQGYLKGCFSLLPIQKSFFQINLAYPNFFNQAFLIKTPQLAFRKLQYALSELLAQHDALRLSFYEDSVTGMQQQYNELKEDIKIKLLDISDYDEESWPEIADNVLTKWQSDFDIFAAPLFNVGYITGFRDGSARLFFAAHHLIVDTVSWRIIKDDLYRLYNDKSLLKKTSSYRQWVNAISNYADKNLLEVDYWQQHTTALEVISSHIFKGLNVRETLTAASIDLNDRETMFLIEKIHSAYHTDIKQILLVALVYSLHDCFNFDEFVITFEGHGRESIDATVDLTRTVGWFTTLYPLKLEVKANLAATITSIKEIIREVPNHGVGYSALGVDQYSEIGFNYLGKINTIDEEWQIVNESVGDKIHKNNTLPYLVNFFGMLISNQLNFTISTRFEQSLTDRLAVSFKTQLLKIIDFCTKAIQEKTTKLTPGDFPHVNISQEHLDDLNAKNNIEAIYPANSLQLGFISNYLARDANTQEYHTHFVYEYFQAIDEQKYKQAWQYVIQKNPILRTFFDWSEQIMQVVVNGVDVHFTALDISNDQDKVLVIEQIKNSDRSKPFNLQQPNLLRLYLVKLTDSKYYLLRSEHHIISDGWSGPLLLEQVHNYYQSLLSANEMEIVTDKSYFLAQEYIIANLHKLDKYWQEETKKIRLVNNISPLLTNPINLNEKNTFCADSEETIVINSSDYSSLKQFARELGVTVNTIIQFSWHKLINIYTKDTQTIVGSTVSGRTIPIEGIENSIGFYVNTLPLILEWDDRTIRDKLHAIHNKVAAVNTNCFYRLDDIQKNGQRLFYTIFAFENYPNLNKDPAGTIKYAYKSFSMPVDYPLVVMVFEINNNLYIKFLYDKNNLSQVKAELLLNQLARIINQVSMKVDNISSAISLLSLEDYQNVVYKFNSNVKKYQSNSTLDSMFFKQALQTPRSLAVIDSCNKYTYKEISEKAAKIQTFLNKKTNNIKQSIAIISEKSHLQVLVTLGVMANGCAYLPLNISWPIKRITAILDSAAVKIILVTKEQFKAINNTSLISAFEIYVIEDIIQKQPINQQICTSHSLAADIAYVIYTSGSTGNPKGVVISHAAACNTIFAVNERFAIGEFDRVFAISDLSFDLSVYDFFGLLAVGGAVVIPDQGQSHNPASWQDLMVKHEVTVWNSTPQLMELLLENFYNSKCLDKLKVVLMSGDWIPIKLPQKIKQYNKNTTVMSLGGATEASIWSIWYEINNIDASWKSIPYGKAMPNQQIYILDQNLNPCPIGVIGEIYIGGMGVAQGYLNLPETTNKHFLRNPFSRSSFKTLYKTGDLGRWYANGYVEYIGRCDVEIKHHGFRVDFSEVEQALLEIVDIKQAIVTSYSSDTTGSSNLVAYYTLDDENINHKVVDNWQVYYDNLYCENYDADNLNPEYNFVGWNSYITGKALDLQEMQNWLQHTIIAIRKLEPLSVLELGVGTGLLMYQLLDKVKRYDGLDISSKIVNSHQEYIAQKSYACPVRLEISAVDKYRDFFDLNNYDCVVINSVCQYFPNIAYFEQVFVMLINDLKPGAKIFLGDIRDFDLQHNLVNEKNSTRKIESDLDFNFKENELLISPRYFLSLVKKYPSISIDILEKHGSFRNELNTYRYDVVISKRPVLTSIDIDLVLYTDSLNFDKQLKQHLSKGSLFIDKIPNMKLSGIVCELQDQIIASALKHDVNCKIFHYSEFGCEYISCVFSTKDIYLNDILDLNNVSDKNTFNVPFINRLETVDLCRHLSTILPSYMIPSNFILLNEIPLTANGKLDKSELPVPSFRNTVKKIEHARTELEVRISNIWKDILNISELTIYDDFYMLGGDSILSIQLMSKLRQHNLDCDYKTILDNRNVHDLASALERKQKVLLSEPIITQKPFPLIPIQKWFFVQEFERPEHWNQAFLVKTPVLSSTIVTDLVSKLLSRHDCLRLNFLSSPEGMQQKYVEDVQGFEVKRLCVRDYSDKEITNILTSWQSHFDLTQGDLWQVGYLYGYADGSARLFFAFHHLIVDSVSWRIITNDLKNIYLGNELPPKSSTYYQWSRELQEYAHSHQNEVNYWRSFKPHNIEYSKYYTAGKVNSSLVTLSTAETSDLLRVANQAYTTQINDLLLTVLSYAFKQWNKLDSTYITLEGHGRELANQEIDLTATVGWFTTMFPIKLQVADDIAWTIINIKEMLRAVPNNGIGFGVFKYLSVNSALDDIELPPLRFNYLGQFNSSLQYWDIIDELPGQTINDANSENLLIDINAYIMAEQLNFRIVTRLDSQEHQRFVYSLQDNISSLIKHCTAKVAENKNYFTKSDFTNLNITDKILFFIQNKYKVSYIFNATSLQQGFIYHYLTNPTDDSYYLQTVYEYLGNLDIHKYKEAWEMAIKRFPALRLCFNWDETPIQIISQQGDLKFLEHDIESTDKQLVDIINEDRLQRFDFTKPTLFRLNLVKHANSRYTLIKTSHHIIVDGWSEANLIKFVHAMYSKLLNAETPNISQDLSYINTQEFISDNVVNANNFWRKRVPVSIYTSSKTTLLNSDTNLNNKTSGSVSLSYKDERFNSLKKVSLKQGIPMNILLQFAWHKVLSVYTQSSKTIVGTVVSGRSIPVAGIEESVGLYINTLPSIIDWKANLPLLEQLKSLHKQILDMNQYSFAELTKLQPAEKQLFNNIIAFENYPYNSNEVNISGLKFRYIDNIDKVNYPLSLLAHETESCLSIELNYFTSFLSTSDAQNLLDKVANIFDDIPNKLNNLVNDISVLGTSEFNKIIYNWSGCFTPLYTNESLQEKFEEVVVDNSDSLAIVCGGRSYTYQQINNQSNQLCNYIQSMLNDAVNPKIAIFMPRSPEVIISCFAVLKIGGAYVPINSNIPDKRAEQILQQTGCELLLTHTDLKGKLQNLNIAKIYVDDVDCYSSYDYQNPSCQRSLDSLSYIMFTSGTVANPKGVLITDRSIINYSQAVEEYFSGVQRIDFSTNFAFDLSITTTIIPMLLGKCIYIYAGELLDIEGYKQHLLSNKIDFLKSTPRYLSELFAKQTSPIIKKCFVGGEKLSRGQLVNILRGVGEVYDEYGPTEATVGATIANKTQVLEQINSIGRPYPNYKLYILDENLQPVPTGMLGELYISGFGLAIGYLDQAELTAEKFIVNKFANADDKVNGFAVMYKTGDICRWLEDGQVEYVARRDKQVKVNGFRVDLNEIEEAMLSHIAIAQSFVLLQNHNNNQYIVAYYTANKLLADEEINNFLLDILPEYMLPNIYIASSEFTLDENGKIDQTRLRTPVFNDSQQELILASNDDEIKLSEIWKEVLSLEYIGIHDDFFKLGGNSILSIQLVNKMAEVGFYCKVVDIFKYKTIYKLIKNLNLHVNAKEFTPYVVNNVRQKSPVIFMFPPAKANAEAYFNNLLPELSNNKIISFNNYLHYLSENYPHKAHAVTIESLANEYIKFINNLNEYQPYTFVGWSLGGVLALEVARQLSLEKLNVKNIILIDSCFSQEKISQDYQPTIDNISYSANFSLPKSKVILFKCNKLEPAQSTEYSSNYKSEYYVKTKDNHLSDVLSSNFDILRIEASHYGWSQDKAITRFIASHIQELL